MQGTCEIDGKPLKRGAGRYCSIECRSEGRRRQTLAQRAICARDGCPNPVTMKHHRYCSQECAGKGKRDRHPCGNPDCPDQKQIRLQRQYCSRECERAIVGTRLLTLVCVNASCPRLGEPFQRYASLVRNPERAYCSGTCRAAGRVYARGADHPNWKGGAYVSDGYRYVQDPSGERRQGGNARARGEHIVVAEQKLGRSLVKGEHVHHLNGNKLDNRPENLLVLPNHQHRALHGFYSQQFQAEHAAVGDLVALTLDFLATLCPEVAPIA